MSSHKIMKIFVNFLRITLIFAILISILNDSLFNLFISSGTFILTLLPAWFGKKYKITIPLDFELAIIFFLYASLYLGEVHNFYERFWWWDIVLHAGSALAFGCMGFVILYILFKTNKIDSNPAWLAVFSFCFALSIGALWEIFEFSMDRNFGTNMQKSGLVDTMWDLIVDSVGAILASLSGYAYFKGDQQSFLNRFIKYFINLFKNDNPDLKI